MRGLQIPRKNMAGTAIKQAHNSEVKEHAKMMLKDHKKAG